MNAHLRPPRLPSLSSFDAGRFDATPEPQRMRMMFGRISGSYDRLNSLMTAGLHHRWRELAVMVAQLEAGCSALDVCCGTGDVAFELRRAVGASGRVVGLDFSEDMLEVARDKCGRNQLYVEFVRGDVMELPFPDGAPRAEAVGKVAGATPGVRPAAGFDACTVGFGIRNVPDIVGAFREMRRVCRPGGRVVCLEITQPAIPVFREFYALWFRRAVPVLGRLAVGDGSAYTYLPASVLRFPPPEALKGLMEQAGLRNVRYNILAGGIIALHYGIV